MWLMYMVFNVHSNCYYMVEGSHHVWLTYMVNMQHSVGILINMCLPCTVNVQHSVCGDLD